MPRFPRVCHRLSALAALGLLACSVQATAPDPATAEEVQGGRDLSDRFTVPVTINGGGPYHFLVDTGSERTVLSYELAGRLTLAPSTAVTLVSIAGTEQVQTAMVPELKVTSSRSTMADFVAPLLSETDMGAVGILGIDSLQTKRVIMDFRRMRMSISDAPRARQADSDEIIVTAKRRLGQLIMVDADIEGQKISVVIDTGSAVSIGNPLLRAALTRRHRLGVMVPIAITSVTGDKTLADYTSIRQVRIGGVTLRNMPAAFADPQIFHRLGLNKKPSLLLGMDVLRLFNRVSIDFANRNVRFMLPGGAARDTDPRLAGSSVARQG